MPSEDYHISIYTKPHYRNPSLPRPPVQNLTFSVYGPNNQDHFLQASYRRTKDDAYIQSLPTGEFVSFVARPNDAISRPLWMRTFSDPVYVPPLILQVPPTYPFPVSPYLMFSLNSHHLVHVRLFSNNLDQI